MLHVICLFSKIRMSGLLDSCSFYIVLRVLAIAINQEKEIKSSKKEKGGGWREIEMIEIERL